MSPSSRTVRRFRTRLPAKSAREPGGWQTSRWTYDPPAREAAELRPEREEAADGRDLVACWRQPAPARRLPRLQGIAILLLTAEASYHAAYDHCTSKYLTQAGVAHTFARLEAAGIRGNGHMMMLEKNNLAVAAYIQQWLTTHVR